MDGCAPTRRIALGLALVALGAGTSFPPVVDDLHAAVPSALAGIPDLKLRYYDASGRTAAEIRASLNRSNATDPVTGRHFDAYTETEFAWFVPGDGDGPCRPDQAKVTLELTVALPRLRDTGSVPPALLRQWKRYRAALEAHEARHARNAVEARKAMLAAIRATDCRKADWAADDVLAELDDRDEDYDRVTEHGAIEGAFFP